VFGVLIVLLAMAALTIARARQLQEDLVEAFNAREFQSRLSELQHRRNLDLAAFMMAMRETALVAQVAVLIKHEFTPNPDGVRDMVESLTMFFMEEEGIDHKIASGKAKALAIGMESGSLQGWSWPVPPVPADDAASTCDPGSDCDDIAMLSDVDIDCDDVAFLSDVDND